MIFVDTNVFMYAVGRPHALRTAARDFFTEAKQNQAPLCTSAEVLQELAHAYLPVGRQWLFDEALNVIATSEVEVWPLEAADVSLARQLYDRFPNLQARDLCYLASCLRRGVREIKTFDEALAAAAQLPAS